MEIIKKMDQFRKAIALWEKMFITAFVIALHCWLIQIMKLCMESMEIVMQSMMTELIQNKFYGTIHLQLYKW